MPKFALTFPPTFDGELQIRTEDAPNDPFITRTITVQVTVPPQETPEATIRQLGRHMVNQPLRKRPE